MKVRTPKRDFDEMTADEIEQYRGIVYRATVWWKNRHAPRGYTVSDLESISLEHLNRKINSMRGVYDVRFGPHTPRAQTA